MRRKGELSPAELDRLFPHQVALQTLAYREQFHRDLQTDAFRKAHPTMAPRGHSLVRGDSWWNVYCFSDRGDAEKFRSQFGGEWCLTEERGKGANWMVWSPRATGKA